MVLDHKKQLMAYLGSPKNSHKAFYVVDVLDAISVVYEQEDMLNVLEMTGEKLQGLKPVPAIIRATQSSGILADKATLHSNRISAGKINVYGFIQVHIHNIILHIAH